ncbi:hypothetical protein [Desulfobulbus sp.]|uniref:hypothetical protein n=1 Tax=Desulfobulbus sp. TaxID=895 RepID=UPI0027B9AC06|nr:hypothetical protein [Desulfobulbus sp.]
MSDETNVFIQQAEDTGFLQEVVAVLKAFGIDPESVTVLAGFPFYGSVKSFFRE